MGFGILEKGWQKVGFVFLSYNLGSLHLGLDHVTHTYQNPQLIMQMYII